MTALHPPERVDGVGMWGHEMLSWSDAGVPRGDASAGLIELVLTEGLGAGAAVLVVGPHPRGLLSALSDLGASVDVLVRSWPDAVETAGRGLSGVDVHCGSWDRFAPGSSRWDVVLVPDGLSRIRGPESDPADWAETLTQLSGLVAEDGSVVVGVANPLSARMLWSIEERSDADDAWPTQRGVEATPASARAVRGWSEHHGLGARVLSLFPHHEHPTVAVDHVVLADPTDPRLARTLTDAFVGDTQLPIGPHDPRGAVGLVLRQRLGEELAPGWYVRVGRDLGPATACVYGGETPRGPHFGCRVVTEVDGPSWSRSVPETDLGERRSGPVSRDPRRLVGGVPPGPSLEDDLLSACAAHDLMAVRRTARTYADWLDARAESSAWTSPWSAEDVETCAVVDGRLAFAGLDNLRDDGAGGVGVIDDSWDLAWRLPRDAVLVATFVRFAERLVSSGARHPFPPGESPWGLARSFAAMTGRDLRDRDGERAAALTAAIAAALEPAGAQAGPDDAVRAVDEARRPYGGADFHGLTTLLEAVDASAREIGVLRDQVEWLLGRVVVENRRRIAMTARAKRAESHMRLRSRIGRRWASTSAAKGLEAWQESRARRGGRWQPPTDEAFAAEVEQAREQMGDAGKP